MSGCVASLIASLVCGHGSTPMLLELSERGDVIEVLWKTATSAEGKKATARPVMPAHCTEVRERQRVDRGLETLERWTISCGERGLPGAVISIEGLVFDDPGVMVRLEPSGQEPVLGVIKPSQPSMTLPERQGWTMALGSSFLLGVEHLWLGIDHLFFVLGLTLLIRSTRTLIGAVTAFSVAHSLTLAGSTLGLVSISSTVAEAVIALSIVYLAIELARPESSDGLGRRWPWLAAFGFGLLHGFGFAGALAETGLPSGQLAVVLLGFNLGVEAGQLVFVLAVLLAAKVPVSASWRGWARTAALYGIGTAGAFWSFERISRILQ